jgi:hypothetical protein
MERNRQTGEVMGFMTKIMMRETVHLQPQKKKMRKVYLH